MMRPNPVPQVHRAMSLNTGVEATSLLQEMKQKQELRERRQKLKQELDSIVGSTRQADLGRIGALRMELATVEGFLETVDGALVSRPKAKEDPLACSPNDPEASMLYVGSMAPDWTEEMLWREFSRFGDVKHANIINSAAGNPRARGARVGSVRFASRQQAELAMSKMSGQVYFGMAIYVYFAKPLAGAWVRKVPGARSLPECYNCGSMYHFAKECPHPPRDGLNMGGVGGGQGMLGLPAAGSLQALPGIPGVRPVLATGNMGHVANPADANGSALVLATGAAQVQAALARRTQFDRAKVLNVEIPGDFNVKSLIDNTAAVVAEEGWEFEKLLFDKEQDNPRFSFLVNRSENLEHPFHLYYRWRTFAFAQGDTAMRWRTEPFKIYENGPVWKPPPCKGKDWVADENLPKLPASKRRDGKGRPLGTAGGADLSSEETMALEKLIAEDLSLQRPSLLAAMVFCLDNANSSQVIAHTICSSISGAEPGVTGKQLTARLYLLSDVLFNSHCSRPGASMYRRMFQEYLPEVFEKLRQTSEALPVAESMAFQETIRRLLCTWSEWSTFPPQFLRGLEATLSQRTPSQSSAAADEMGKMPEGSRTHMELERQCRLRGLAITGKPQQLVERLSHFEAYWKEMTSLFPSATPTAAEVAEAMAEPVPAEAEAGEANQAAAPAEPELPPLDPELDGESLAGSDLDIEECNEPLLVATIPLLREDDDLEVEASAPEQPVASCPEPEEPKSEEPADIFCNDAAPEQAPPAPEAPEEEATTPGAREAKEEKRRKELLRQVEQEVMRFQAALEAARVMPDLIAMKCDKKRMELLESAAQEEAVLDMRVRTAGAKSKGPEAKVPEAKAPAASTPAAAAASGGSASSRPPRKKERRREAEGPEDGASSKAVEPEKRGEEEGRRGEERRQEEERRRAEDSRNTEGREELKKRRGDDSSHQESSRRRTGDEDRKREDRRKSDAADDDSRKRVEDEKRRGSGGAEESRRNGERRKEEKRRGEEQQGGSASAGSSAGQQSGRKGKEEEGKRASDPAGSRSSRSGGQKAAREPRSGEARRRSRSPRARSP